ncbi:hypothetical protein [Paraburkholderia azotifigens]|uniref:Uncharacterized protein n=1 Tax=Paraburkholderia azotifigens TaxID=2057004 RepID=A0A5C6VG72_9BURK|nr:hypothetical protein [Paraburkholderia azotifigens]TXC83930.1 hypothetical protein FRZ40_26685 [Paraburkholderia azotifigens]
MSNFDAARAEHQGTMRARRIFIVAHPAWRKRDGQMARRWRDAVGSVMYATPRKRPKEKARVECRRALCMTCG